MPAAEDTKKKKQDQEAKSAAKAGAAALAGAAAGTGARTLPPSLQQGASAAAQAAAPGGAAAVDLCGSQQEKQRGQDALQDASNKRGVRSAHGSASPDAKRACVHGTASAASGPKGAVPGGALAKARAASAGAAGGGAVPAAQLPLQNHFKKFEAKQQGVAWQKRSNSASARGSAGASGQR